MECVLKFREQKKKRMIKRSKSRSSTMMLFLIIWEMLKAKRRIQLSLLVILAFVSALAELISLGTVIPFLAVISQPEKIWNVPIVQNISGLLEITSKEGLLAPATILFIVATIASSCIRVLNVWANGKVASEIGSDISCMAFNKVLQRNYQYHINTNTSKIISTITTQVNQLVVALNALLQLTISTAIATSLMVGMLTISFKITCISIGVLVIIYWNIILIVKKDLQLNGRLITDASSKQIKVLQESLGMIREVILGHHQGIYSLLYREIDLPQRKLQARNKFLGVFPRYLLEATGITGIAIIGYVLTVNQPEKGLSSIALLGALALGAQRLLPTIQQIYTNWSTFNTRNAAIYDVIILIGGEKESTVMTSYGKIEKVEKIEMRNLCFKYSTNERKILDNVNFEIKSGEKVAIIGTTGSGKSTAIDMLMGLIQPTSGKIMVNGKDINDGDKSMNLKSWRNSVAHVPQSIYLIDSTIAKNIAFGIPERDIDMDKVKYVAKRAQISGFIDSLDDKYSHLVGENGVKLSGGQRQRLGIARALYKDAQVLILDEATSALDDKTEGVLMKSLLHSYKDMTIIMVAHRLSSIKYCESVYKLEKGRLNKWEKEDKS
ncbi:ABC transporter type 1/ ATPase component [Synechococcus sp. M16.1]|nr:ABC transporter type 1/ ATPase component [Synechococcus sp. M16.1]